MRTHAHTLSLWGLIAGAFFVGVAYLWRVNLTHWVEMRERPSQAWWT